MNISEKIAEINQKPQHIRMRWVWGSVTVSMLLIAAIWIFSIVAMLKNDSYQKNTNQQDSAASLKQQIQEISKQAPSLKDFTPQQTPTASEGISAKSVLDSNNSIDDNLQDNNGSLTDTESQIPSSSAYNSQ